MNELIIQSKLVIAYQHLQDSSKSYDKGCDLIRELLKEINPYEEKLSNAHLDAVPLLLSPIMACAHKGEVITPEMATKTLRAWDKARVPKS